MILPGDFFYVNASLAATASRSALLILQRTSPPTTPPQPCGRPINYKPRRNQQESKRQSTNPQNLLALAMHNRKSQQQQRKHSNQNRPRHPARHFERPP